MSTSDAIKIATERGVLDASSPWSIEVDAETGRGFFFNSQTDATLWELPAGVPVWAAHFDEEGDPFFVSEDTGETLWAAPDAAVIVAKAP